MKQIVIALLLLIIIGNNLHGQPISFKATKLEPIQVSMLVKQFDGKEVVKVVKDSTVQKVDEPTFVKIGGTNFKNGVIEVKVLSKLLANAPDTARGFIGIAFHINDDNSRFEGIYLRPTNGRALQQIRRNHSIQYFSFPDYKYNILRTMAPGVYESYADMDLNQWIKMKIVVKDAQAILFLNDNSQPSLIVSDLKHGKNNKGAIGLFVDIGTEGYFSELKVLKEN